MGKWSYFFRLSYDVSATSLSIQALSPNVYLMIKDNKVGGERVGVRRGWAMIQAELNQPANFASITTYCSTLYQLNQKSR